MVKYSVNEAGADPLRRNEKGATALYAAPRSGSFNSLPVLLAFLEDKTSPEESGTLIDTEDIDGKTALIVSVINNELQCVLAFLAKDADDRQ